MSQKLLALVWATGEAGARPGPVPLGQNLLGKSILQLTLETVASLGPRKIFVVGLEGAPKRGRPSVPTGAQWLTPGREDAGGLAAIRLACDRLNKYPSDNLIVLDARLARLTSGTLRLLLKAHVKQNNSLTKAAEVGKPPLFVARVRDLAAACVGRASRGRAPAGIDDLIRALAETGDKTGCYRVLHPEELLTVRTPEDVSEAVAFLRRKKVNELESRGVIVLDREATWVDLDVRIGRGTVLYPSVVIEGRTTIGRDCRVYPFVHLVDSQLGDRVKVLTSVMIERSRVEDDAQVGPFTHFRPNTIIRPAAKVGNFVEMKNTVFGKRSKAGHLSYLGDSIIEDGVNIGAGTITCNYDGFKKSQTVIERGAFIGSGTELVAPVRIGRRAYIGAGSVITEDVSPGALAIARGRQVEKPGWARRKKTK